MLGFYCEDRKCLVGGRCSSSSGSCSTKQPQLVVSECRTVCYVSVWHLNISHTRMYIQACTESHVDWSHKVIDSICLRVKGRVLHGDVGSSFYPLRISVRTRLTCSGPSRLNMSLGSDRPLYLIEVLVYVHSATFQWIIFNFLLQYIYDMLTIVALIQIHFSKCNQEIYYDVYQWEFIGLWSKTNWKAVYKVLYITCTFTSCNIRNCCTCKCMNNYCIVLYSTLQYMLFGKIGNFFYFWYFYILTCTTYTTIIYPE